MKGDGSAATSESGEYVWEEPAAPIVDEAPTDSAEMAGKDADDSEYGTEDLWEAESGAAEAPEKEEEADCEIAADEEPITEASKSLELTGIWVPVITLRMRRLTAGKTRRSTANGRNRVISL